MMYDVIVLGATFASAGIATVLGEKALILERRPQAGYEFLNALNFGTNYDVPLMTEEAKLLCEKFTQKGAFLNDRVCLFDCAGLLYQCLENKNVYLNMEPISVETEENGFKVTVHGVSGYRTFYAKKVIDTRCNAEISESKTLNLLVKNLENPEAVLPGAAQEKWGYAGDVTVKIPVEQGEGYIEARKKVKAFLEQMPAGFKAVCVADCFAEQVAGSFPVEKNGIILLPSVAYDNPFKAFDAGVLFARGGDRV